MSHSTSMRRVAAISVSALAALALTGPAALACPPEPTLRSETPRDLKIGSAVWGQRDLLDHDRKNGGEFQRILGAEFNSLTPENDMKWAEVHPEPDVYDFSGADAVVAFAKAHRQEVRGHTLLWHSQNPQWVIDAAADWTCEEARDVLEDHVRTVVGRYAGEIYEWDVANEIFQDDWDEGGVRLRTEANPFLKACAEDPVALLGDVFRWAHEADPEAVLFLNDYNAEGINAKTDAYYELAQELLADGAPLHGFGAQGHLSLQYGFDESIQENFERFADLGLKVAVTEADVRMPLGEDGEPDAEQIALQAERYDKMLQACLDVPACTSYTVWGFDDGRSWVPGVFPEGYATIMTEEFEKKPAYHALLESLTEATPGRSPRTPPGLNR
ncbi:endo-1,4-beta-xylanase [Myceligenerans pegani]|uniref:Beta-xylanase n=1 Tax=Myceligenerans pegani TaxID=2776917 RepID=A0ABR9MZ10_9MICO|nr:endo-1,4-beta-xylanase [Myceligenerans sp. TRM 65318]MBE1876098.1 endo-1,4-beta-xylanase [Myceligenerans sp. TRM 65318]MBE3018369.1 endo-1,4-beta-xylanase [Myceligenerans sp. TRM 65318]